MSMGITEQLAMQAMQKKIEELEKRVAKLEERKKPGPKPKAS